MSQAIFALVGVVVGVGLQYFAGTRLEARKQKAELRAAARIVAGEANRAAFLARQAKNDRKSLSIAQRLSFPHWAAHAGVLARLPDPHWKLTQMAFNAGDVLLADIDPETVGMDELTLHTLDRIAVLFDWAEAALEAIGRGEHGTGFSRGLPPWPDDLAIAPGAE